MRTAIAAGGAAWEGGAVHAVQTTDGLSLVRRCVDVADLLAAADAEIADLALVSPSLPGLDLTLVDQLSRAGMRIVAVREGDTTTAEMLGIADFIGADEIESLVKLDRAGPRSMSDHAPIVAVWGPTGAPGRSTVALALATVVARSGQATVLIDADVEGGAQAQALGLLDDVSGLISAVREANQGRIAQATAAALEIEQNLRLLTGLPRADMATQVRIAAYDAVLSSFRSAAERVIVDCGFSLDVERGGRGAITVHTLQQADAIIVLGRADPLGLARLVRSLHDLDQLLPQARPYVVINHVRRSLGWSIRELDQTVRRLTGRGVDLYLPWDQITFDEAAMTGRSVATVAPTCDFVSQITAFTAEYLPVAVSRQ